MRLETFQGFREDCAVRLGALSPWHRLAFAMVVSRRFLPHYRNFVTRGGRGSLGLLSAAQSLLERALAGPAPPPQESELAVLLPALEGEVPDSEMCTRHPDDNLAQDAVLAHIHVVHLLRTSSAETCLRLAELCYNWADDEASSHLVPTGGLITREVEDAIGTHPFVQRELSWVRRTLSAVAELPPGSWPLPPLMRSLWEEPLYGRPLSAQGA